MEELIVKVDNLINEIDSTPLVRDIKKLNKEIKKDKELQSLLEEYRLTKNEKIKSKILDNCLFREYKLKETDLNILIMSINQKLKAINNERRCSK